MAALPRGRVQFTTTEPALTVVVLRVDQVTLTGGVGGWEIVGRPYRKGLTEWQGRDPIQQAIPVLFDGYADGRSVEPEIQNLIRMGIPHGQVDPPTVRIAGPVLRTELDWHLNGIEYGDAIWNDERTERLRQAATVTLIEHVADERLESAAHRQSKRTTVYVVKKGEGLPSIAAHKLGDASRWKEIAKLNGIRDPHRVKAGQRIKLP